MSSDEITKKDYVLTNMHTGDLGYYIRLKDDKEYQLYIKKPRGQKQYHFIKKDGKEIRLSKEVEKWVISSIREYERYGI